MVGLNHEMSRELLWREYPTDQRGTYFRQFWDVRGYVPATSEEEKPLEDIPPIHTWPAAKRLGQNFKGAASQGQLVLLIRGELIRRYPTAIIYAVKAVWPGGKKRRLLSTNAEDERYPLFRGKFDPDVTFLGFDLKEADARGTTNPNGDPGWFFVIQEQPTEPRFGLDVVGRAEPRFGGQPNPTKNWSDLSWSHLVTDEQSFQALIHVQVRVSHWQPSKLTINRVTWGQNSAHMAYITLQRPVRLAIHADMLLPSQPIKG